MKEPRDSLTARESVFASAYLFGASLLYGCIGPLQTLVRSMRWTSLVRWRTSKLSVHAWFKLYVLVTGASRAHRC